MIFFLDNFLKLAANFELRFFFLQKFLEFCSDFVVVVENGLVSEF